MARRGLGANPLGTNMVAGVGIFTPTDKLEKDGRDVATVKISTIRQPVRQPRRYFDTQKLEQLIDSIKKHGILEPLIVRSLTEGNYELVAGERRFRAAREIGLEEVLVVVRELSDLEAMELALIENLQREDLNPVEETEGILALLSAKLHLSVSEVSSLLHRLAKRGSDNVVGNEEELEIVRSVFQAIGRMNLESFATHRLPLLNLPEPVLEALRAGRIEYTKARALARVKDSALMEHLLGQSIAKEWSLTQIRQAINTGAKTEQPETLVLKKKFNRVTKALNSSAVWEDPAKCRRLEHLLSELQQLVAN
jgi:ParB family chromosome partitioning protein